MLNFEPFSVTALQKVMPFIQQNPSVFSDISAGYMFMWGIGNDLRFCVWNDTFSVRQNIGEQPAFSYPYGKDPDGMTDELIKYTYENHLPLRFFAVDGKTLDIIRADKRLQPAAVAWDRRWSDYIYDFEEASTFKGRKFRGQRNHINKFKKFYGEPDIRFLTDEDKPGVEELFREYRAEHPPVNALEKREQERAEKLFDIYKELGLLAAGLFINGNIVALCIGEIRGDILIIHVEKALSRYEGIYPAMYSGFVRLTGGYAGLALRAVNREDDSGDAGLRTSKMQYQPVSIENKHLVHIKSPALGSPPEITVARGNIVLTEIRGSDKTEYMKLNTDVENNHYWGYDYRDDNGITSPVDENTFYDAVKYDMLAGDSINFAVRLEENEAMIGEAVLWNFTSDGYAEVGCRIFPEYQGKGYGKAAFGAAADYAARTLRLKPTARCYKENAASYRMITANGFSHTYSDETFHRFEYTGPVSER